MTKIKTKKNDYFLIKVFDNLNRRKSLEIVKYNKYIKKRININVNDYKEYSEIYSSIEIEIKPIKNKYGKFINIKKGEESFYHIYINNNKKEIKRDLIDKKDKKIKIIIDYRVKSFYELFFYCDCIESINFIKFYRNNITNMSYMFYGCSMLKEINFYNFNTDNVTDMRFMFFKCESLKEINLSKFNTNKVTNMSWMFFKCESLKEINLSNFNINKVQ